MVVEFLGVAVGHLGDFFLHVFGKIYALFSLSCDPFFPFPAAACVFRYFSSSRLCRRETRLVAFPHFMRPANFDIMPIPPPPPIRLLSGMGLARPFSFTAAGFFEDLDESRPSMATTF